MSTKFHITIFNNLIWNWESPILRPWVRSEESIQTQLSWSKDIPIFEAAAASKFYATKFSLTSSQPNNQLYFSGPSSVVMMDGIQANLSILKGLYISTTKAVQLVSNNPILFGSAPMILGDNGILLFGSGSDEHTLIGSTYISFIRQSQDTDIKFAFWGE